MSARNQEFTYGAAMATMAIAASGFFLVFAPLLYLAARSRRSEEEKRLGLPPLTMGRFTRAGMEPGEVVYTVSNPHGATLLYSDHTPIQGSFPIPYGAMVNGAPHYSDWTVSIPSYGGFVSSNDLQPLASPTT